ncbi:MAG: ATP-binding protein [Pseudomonadales bacterium]|nr:ATP-binding protein [Pseudomonadales bacterium]
MPKILLLGTARFTAPVTLIKVLTLWTLLTLASFAQAAVGIVVDKETPLYELESQAYYVEDADNSLSIEDIANPDFDAWKQSENGTLSFGYTASTYWIHFKLINQNNEDMQRLLEIAYPVLDDVEVHVYRDGLPNQNYRFGDQLPFESRPIDHAHFLVSIDLEPYAETSVYIKIATSSSMQIPLQLWKHESLVERDQDRLISRGVYFGAMIIMALYNLMLFFVLRDKNFLYYVIYVLSISSLLFGINGLSFKYFWPNATSWNDQSLVVSLAGIIIFGLLFTRSFLHVPETRPLLNKFLLAHVYGGYLCIALAFLVPYRYGILTTIIIAMTGVLTCMAAGLIRWKDRYHAVKYYIMAWSFLLGGGVVLALNKFGLVPNNLLTQNAAQIGSAIEVVLLSIALANQMNNERRLREQAQQESLAAQTNAMESLKQYQELYDNAVQGLFLINQQGYFLKINPSVLTILKTSDDDLLNHNKGVSRPITDYFPDIKDLLDSPQKLNRRDSVRIKGITKNNDTVWIVLTLRLVRNAKDEIEHIEGSMVDITESIEKEEALRERKTAESTAEAKSAFLATMSHEIRTPMNGVLGMVEMLRGTKLDFHQSRYINTIYNSGQALLGVINDILDYSKIESNKLEVEKISVDLSEVVDECVSVFSNLCEEKNLPLYVDLDPHIPTRVYSDSTRIRQILLNLLSNAFKFTEKGYVYIRIDQMPEQKIRIAIQDTGIGLSEEEQAKLFKSFSQADSSTTRKYGGTGLGLAISKRLAELMGGEIGVVSQKGAGSKFWFTVTDYQLEKAPTLQPVKGAAQQLLAIGTEDKKFSKAYRRHLNSTVKQIIAFNDVDQMVEHIKKTAEYEEQLFLLQDKFFESIQHHQHYRKIKDRILVLTQPGQATRYQEKVKSQFILERPVSPHQIVQAINACLNPQNPMQELLNEALDIQGMRFLVAEDNTVNQMVIKGILKKHGAEIQLANNGQEALEKYRHKHHQFDVVLMDIEMPIMNGYESVKAIRQYEQDECLSPMPIFGLSAHALAEYMEKATAAGMNGFITKPITVKQLITHLHPLNAHRKAS